MPLCTRVSRCSRAPAQAGSVVVGLRSENVRGWHEGSGLAGPFEGVVQGIEELGRETFAMVALEGGGEITVQLEGLARVRLGERLQFGIEEREVYVFDATTGATLSWPASSSGGRVDGSSSFLVAPASRRLLDAWATRTEARVGPPTCFEICSGRPGR